jgi:threonylcarbamoyladenosine tRNA methylthiotransferase MtaB
MKVSIQTLGCKINQFDAGMLREELAAGGAEVVSGDGADVQVIFTCTVTGRSDYQCRQAIRRAVKAKPEGGLVVVAGCYAETSPEAIKKIHGVDLVVGNNEKNNIASMLSSHTLEAPLSLLPVKSAARAEAMGGRSRASLRVQEGCDSSCSYCIVPRARGKSRSAPESSVLEQADRLIGRGYHEIVLTGVHLGSYGRDFGGGTCLSGLVEKLIDRPGLGRLRLSSIEPMEIDDRLIELTGSGKLCRHFHVPLQSADDAVLSSMNRGYSADEYFSVIDKLERAAPGACLGADVIVGYPIEDDASFEETYRRISDSPLNHLHVFSYSPRPGTPAHALGDAVHGDVKKERSKRLRELAAIRNMEFRRRFAGRDMEVVVEDKDGLTSGLSDNYIRVRFEADGIASKSKALVRIVEVMDGYCTGVVI